MFAVEYIQTAQKPDGSYWQPGDINIHPDAWMLCLPGVRNSAPICKPADEITAAKVSRELAERQPEVDATKVYLQERIDAIAADGKYKIDPTTGFFARLPNGDLAGSPSNIDAHVMETADGYHLTPAVPAQTM